jgi:hypothetical protein
MAVLALAAAGAAIGGVVAPGVIAFGMTGAAIGWTIGAAAGNLLFAPRSRAQGPRLQDLNVTSSTFGVTLPTCWGTMRTAGNVIWARPLTEHVHTERTGKGGGGSTYTSYTYSATFAVAICEGEITALTRIWANNKLIYDIRADGDPSMVGASDEVAKIMQVFAGTESQLPSSIIENYDGAGNVPAYRGTGYVVFENFPLADYGNVNSRSSSTATTRSPRSSAPTPLRRRTSFRPVARACRARPSPCRAWTTPSPSTPTPRRSAPSSTQTPATSSSTPTERTCWCRPATTWWRPTPTRCATTPTCA